jgi:hypothetical protein
MNRGLLLLIFFFALTWSQTPLPHLPKLPDQFSMGVEVNVLHKNVTKHVKLFYDKPGERARMDFYGGAVVKTLWDFNKDEEWTIFGKANCSSGKASDSYIADPDDNTKMMTPDQLFHWSGGENYEYQGLEQVRSISANHWSKEETKDINDVSTHALRKHHSDEWKGAKSVSYTLHWYFSAADWDIYNGEQEPENSVPLRSVVEGTVTMTDGSTKYFHLSYDIMWFVNGKPSDWKFKLVDWYQCKAHEAPSLPGLPDSFECAVEMTSLSHNFTTSWYSWIDGDNDRARISTSWKGKKITKIIWEDKGKWFKIKEHKCTAKDINKDYDFLGDGQGHLIPTKDMFQFGEGYDQVYQGTREIRGIKCDHWVLERSQSWLKYDFNYTLHWYFSVDGWHMLDTSAHRVPVRAEMYGTMKKSANDNEEHTDEDDDMEGYSFDDFADKDGVVHFHHIYEIVHFLPKEPKEWLFNPAKWTHGCEDYDENGDDDDDGGDYAKCVWKHAGWPYVVVALITGILGVLLGTFVGFFFLRKRAERRFRQEGYVGMGGLPPH